MSKTRDEVAARLMIDDTDLQRERKEQASLYYWCSVNWSKTKGLVESLEAQIKLLKSQVASDARNQLIKDDARVTERRVENEVDMDDVVIGKQRELRAAEEDERIWKSLCEAFLQKKDMLIEIGADRRKQIPDDRTASIAGLKDKE